MRTFNLAAIAALIMFPVVAFAGGESSGNGDEIEDPAQDPGRAAAELNERYGRRPAPAPVAPVAPLPDTGGGEVVNPPPTAPPFVFDPGLPPVVLEDGGEELFHIGVLAGGSVGAMPVREQILESGDPATVFGGEGFVGAYVLFTESREATLYGGVHGALGMGTLDSRLYTGGVDLGWMVTDKIGIGGQGDFLVRDLLWDRGTWETRYLGGAVGPQAMFRLDDPDKAGEAWIVTSITGGGGAFVRDVDTFGSLAVNAQLRIGLGDRSKHAHD